MSLFDPPPTVQLAEINRRLVVFESKLTAIVMLLMSRGDFTQKEFDLAAEFARQRIAEEQERNRPPADIVQALTGIPADQLAAALGATEPP
jgi:hypothetical protein